MKTQRLLAIAVILSCPAACALPPDSAPWRQEQAVIRPEGRTSTDPKIQGHLIVETAEIGNPEEGRIPHAPYYIYDPRGKYVDRFPNEYLTAVGLSPGSYVVVSRCSGAYRRVQVEVAADQTTVVSLKDFKSAPSAD